MDGYELFKRCRDLRPGVPVIFVTGAELKEKEAINIIKASNARYLSKPFDITELIDIAERLTR